MSAAALPSEPGYKELALAKQEGCILYTGNMEGANVEFYFHFENKMFACETQVDGKDVKMIGDLKRPKDKPNHVICIPKWAINPESIDDEFENAVGEEKKVFDLSEKEVDFEGCKLTLKGNGPDKDAFETLNEIDDSDSD